MTVVALSTDDYNLIGDFFKGVRRPGFVLGWAGSGAMARTHTRNVPATFVLAPNRRVVFYSGSQLRSHEEVAEVLERQLTREEE